MKLKFAFLFFLLVGQLQCVGQKEEFYERLTTLRSEWDASPSSFSALKEELLKIDSNTIKENGESPYCSEVIKFPNQGVAIGNCWGSNSQSALLIAYPKELKSEITFMGARPKMTVSQYLEVENKNVSVIYLINEKMLEIVPLASRLGEIFILDFQMDNLEGKTIRSNRFGKEFVIISYDDEFIDKIKNYQIDKVFHVFEGPPPAMMEMMPTKKND